MLCLKVLNRIRGSYSLTNIMRLKMIQGITDVTIRNSGNLSEVEITTAKVAGDEIRAAIFFMMAKSGWPILEFRSLDPTLEEVFLSITAG